MDRAQANAAKFLLIPILLSLASLAVAGYVGFTGGDKVIAVDLATLKAQRSADKEQLERIENGVRRLEDKVDEALREHRGTSTR